MGCEKPLASTNKVLPASCFPSPIFLSDAPPKITKRNGSTAVLCNLPRIAYLWTSVTPEIDVHRWPSSRFASGRLLDRVLVMAHDLLPHEWIAAPGHRSLMRLDKEPLLSKQAIASPVHGLKASIILGVHPDSRFPHFVAGPAKAGLASNFTRWVRSRILDPHRYREQFLTLVTFEP